MSKVTAIILMILALAFVSGCEKEFGIKSVSPRSGVLGGGEPISILGSGFKSNMGLSVYFGNQKADNVVVAGPEVLTVSTPSSQEPKFVDIRVMTDDGRQFVIKRAFRYIEKASMDIRDIAKRKSQRETTE